jgi:hypothetical protein
VPNEQRGSLSQKRLSWRCPVVRIRGNASLGRAKLGSQCVCTYGMEDLKERNDPKGLQLRFSIRMLSRVFLLPVPPFQSCFEPRTSSLSSNASVVLYRSPRDTWLLGWIYIHLLTGRVVIYQKNTTASEQSSPSQTRKRIFTLGEMQ